MSLEVLPQTTKKEIYNTPELKKFEDSIRASFESIAEQIFEHLDEEVVSRLVFLESHSQFNIDSRLIESGMHNVLNEISRRENGYDLTEERLLEARVAALIHDIGKSGPLEASKDQQLAVVRLFAAENLRNPNQPVEDAVREVFGEEANLMIYNLQGCGIDVSMSMKKFWESHAKWGYEIIKTKCPELSTTTKNIAILHHVDKGPDFNFLNLPMDQIPKESLVLGQLENYVDTLRQRAIIALDQYEAQIRRAKVSHKEAVAWVRKNVSKTFGDDVFMNQILDVMLEMGQEQIFNGSIE
ncbi:MAG: hypothetical protein Q8O46_00600 [bacterium]|nr:hypothetical protein [bacterium]